MKSVKLFNLPFVAEVLGSSDGGWDRLLAALHVPELNQLLFLQQALTHGAYLTLYAHVTQRLPLSQSIQDEFSHLQQLTQWSAQAKPGLVASSIV